MPHRHTSHIHVCFCMLPWFLLCSFLFTVVPSGFGWLPTTTMRLAPALCTNDALHFIVCLGLERWSLQYEKLKDSPSHTVASRHSNSSFTRWKACLVLMGSLRSNGNSCHRLFVQIAVDHLYFRNWTSGTLLTETFTVPFLSILDSFWKLRDTVGGCRWFSIASQFWTNLNWGLGSMIYCSFQASPIQLIKHDRVRTEPPETIQIISNN